MGIFMKRPLKKFHGDGITCRRFLFVDGNGVRLPVSDNVVDHHGRTALFIDLYSKNRSGIGIRIFV